MILICDLCDKSNSLSYSEYVTPIENIVKKSGREYSVIHYKDLNKFSATLTLIDNQSQNESSERIFSIILCGTPLKDNSYLSNLNEFSILKRTNAAILGICAGSQVIAALFGSEIQKSLTIGMTSIKIHEISESKKIFGDRTGAEVYELHGNSFDIPKDFIMLASTGTKPAAMKHSSKNIYAVVFHPEVRNEYVIENFLCKTMM